MRKTKKLKILFVSEFFWPRAAGGEVWAFALCTELARLGHDVTVLTLRHGKTAKEETASGIRILRPYRAGGCRCVRTLQGLRLARYASRHLDAHPADVIHVTAYVMNVPVSRMARGKDVPCITAVHGYFGDAWKKISPAWPFLRWLERRALRQDVSHAIHVPSEYLRARILADTGVQTNVIHHWIPKTLEHAPQPEPDLLVFVGSLEKVKDPLACIPIAKRLGARLVIVGKGSLGGELRHAARKQGADCVLLGELPHEQALEQLARASLVLVPSVSESFSLVALEANAHGTPVSGTPVGIIPELPGTTPFPPESIPARLTGAQVRAVRKRFSKERAIAQILACYRDAMRTRRR
jgi:glycosyltransferase involved in cell wall biosynthesis